ncbi:MAG: hypothetical protein ACOC1F_00215 [Myxococcota bacterium]
MGTGLGASLVWRWARHGACTRKDKLRVDGALAACIVLYVTLGAFVPEDLAWVSQIAASIISIGALIALGHHVRRRAMQAVLEAHEASDAPLSGQVRPSRG